ncbi:PhzF family phenazine biosynthesis protein [Desulfosporosinus nitroreducens]|uniref:PhzF family phenazine biosynthesis protein n=1 Tax=Desulfosporosinus nitroreducens TaxID=2018668 RepID=UPI0035A3774D
MGWDKQEEKWTVIAWENLGCYAGNRGQITDNAAPDPNKSTQINMHAFADKPYYGNHAEVCFLPQQVTDEWMQNISREMF